LPAHTSWLCQVKTISCKQKTKNKNINTAKYLKSKIKNLINYLNNFGSRKLKQNQKCLIAQPKFWWAMNHFPHPDYKTGEGLTPYTIQWPRPAFFGFIVWIFWINEKNG